MRVLIHAVGRRWIAALVLAAVIGFTLFNPKFISPANIGNIAIYATEPLLIALGETVVIIGGGIDLSLGSILGFSSVLSALVMKSLYESTRHEMYAIVSGVVAGVLSSTALGLINGWIIARLHISPFVTTLGMMGTIRGAVYLLTAGHSIFGLPTQVAKIGNIRLGGVIPYQAVLMFVVAFFIHFMLSNTQLGRHIYACGSNRIAAFRSGINVRKVWWFSYTLAGALAGVAGVITTLRFATGSPLAGVNAELTAIAAAVLGGVSLTGGVGDVGGTIFGVLFMTLLLIGLIMANVQPYWQLVAVGVILIFAVVVDRLRVGRVEV
ncbi:MAG: ABC transporter permease [Candidatus Hadarchaeum sp.]|uniref:ABC transporter permease n=1 Tax=Candidatus Hadarchaeum sp. TaxID=2883567 RepID=UPI003175B9CD